MRILIHDYAGYPYVVQLSRRLAARGHEVLLVYCASTQSPRGIVQPLPDDPEAFKIEAIDLGRTIPKAGFLSRLRMEMDYGRRLAEVCERYQPEVVISGNTPSIPQHRLVKTCRRRGFRHVFWVQDIYGLAAYKLLKRKIPGLGHLVGKYFMRLDRRSACDSDALVVIAENFRPLYEGWGVDPQKIHVIHNWSVLEDLPVRPRDNPWSAKQKFGPGARFVYTGTLSMKHNPALLLALAKKLDQQGDGQLLVVSEGSGIEWLQREAQEAGLRSLQCMGFQPFEEVADVMGSADVLVAVLEYDAGVFSVPSKVLSYMCAGRAILGAMPSDNLATRMIMDLGAGRVVDPDDIEGFCKAAQELLDSASTREACGQAARKYAEEHFDIDRIAAQFEEILSA